MLINYFTDPVGLEAQRIESNRVIDEQIALDAMRDEHLNKILANKRHAKKTSHFINAKHYRITAPVEKENHTLMGFSHV